MIFRAGMNPFGIACLAGLHGPKSDRVHPAPLRLDGFIALVRELGGRSIELPMPMLSSFDPARLADLGASLEADGIQPVASHSLKLDSGDAARIRALGARVVRCCMTGVLCGDRSEKGNTWNEMIAAGRQTLNESARVAGGHGLALALENHQDLTSAELVELTTDAGDAAGICFDVGNALAVGESPVEFARTIAPRVRHVHLKDYWPQWTDEGYRLIRCPIGDGAVPFAEVERILGEHHPALTASIEIGALHARHIRLLTPAWWNGYASRPAESLAAGLAAARVRRLDENAEWRTPWERGESPEAVGEYERAQLDRSVENLKSLGMWGKPARAS